MSNPTFELSCGSVGGVTTKNKLTKPNFTLSLIQLSPSLLIILVQLLLWRQPFSPAGNSRGPTNCLSRMDYHAGRGSKAIQTGTQLSLQGKVFRVQYWNDQQMLAQIFFHPMDVCPRSVNWISFRPSICHCSRFFKLQLGLLVRWSLLQKIQKNHKTLQNLTQLYKTL